MLSQIKTGVFSEFCAEAPLKGMRPAAVLCLLIGEINALSILLTKRAPHLNEHAGQISFPGGKLESIDETIVDTALRETKEEVGLSSSEVEVLGFLSPVVTLTGFHIYPVVGYLDKTPSSALQQLIRNPNEVEEIIISPLSSYLDPNRYHLRTYSSETGSKRFLEIKNTNPLVWGATAAILKQLSDISPSKV